MDTKQRELNVLMHQFVEQLSRVIQGKTHFLEHLILSFFVQGHVLIEGFPGIGKTTVIKALTHLIGNTSHGRIQCTPDLLPYDITGVEVFDMQHSVFRFCPGPLFHDIVLIDEINRTTPRTQSALLEAMAETQITVSGKTYTLSPLFWIAATQNPFEQDSTYYNNIPTAELDRFLTCLNPGYPDFKTECQICEENSVLQILPFLKPIIEKDQFINLRNIIDTIYCDKKHIQFAVRVAQSLRSDKLVSVGVSPRGPIGLLKIARAKAIFEGRNFVTDEDILNLIELVYLHRIRSQESRSEACLLLHKTVESASREFYQ